MRGVTARGSRKISVEPIDRDGFGEFGEIIEIAVAEPIAINRGRCLRYCDLAELSFEKGGRAGISLFDSRPVDLPFELAFVERHPLGSQAFIPMSEQGFLAIVAPALADGAPGRPRAFRTEPGQGVNFRRNVWHGVLSPLAEPGLFAVVDRIGSGNNLEEFEFSGTLLDRRGPLRVRIIFEYSADPRVRPAANARARSS